MKIIDIEPIPLRVPYEERIRKQYYHFGLDEQVTVYKFHTDTGLIGLGENPGPPLRGGTPRPLPRHEPVRSRHGRGTVQPRYGMLRPDGETSGLARMETDGAAGASMGVDGVVDALHVTRR